MGQHKIGAAVGAVLIAGFGGWLRLRGIGYGMQGGGYRPDEGYLIEAALDFARGEARLSLPIYPMFLSSLLGMLFWVWRLKLSLVEGIAWSETLEILRSWDLAYARYAARLVCAVFGALTIFETFRLGAALRPGTRGIPYAFAAAFVLAVNFLHVRDSHFVGFDIVAGYFIVFSARKAIGAIRGSRSDEIVSAIAAGLALSTRYQAAFATVIPLIPALVRSFSGAAAEPRKSSQLPAAVLLQSAIMVVTFAVTSPTVIMQSAKVFGAVAQFGFSLDFHGDTGFAWLHGQLLLAAFGPHGRWLILGLLVLIPVRYSMTALRNRRGGDERGDPPVIPGGELVLWLPVYLALAKFCTQKTVFIRYGSAYLPLLIVGAVFVCCRVPFAALRALLLFAVIVLLSVDPLARSVALDRVLEADDTREIFDDRLAELRLPPLPAYVPGTLLYPVPSGLWKRKVVTFSSCDELVAALSRYGEGLLLTAAHPLTYFVPPAPPWLESVVTRSERLITVELPFSVQGEGTPRFEKIDAFFVPFLGLGSVERGGPALTLSRAVPLEDDASLCTPASAPLGMGSAELIPTVTTKEAAE